MHIFSLPGIQNYLLTQKENCCREKRFKRTISFNKNMYLWSNIISRKWNFHVAMWNCSTSFSGTFQQRRYVKLFNNAALWNFSTTSLCGIFHLRLHFSHFLDSPTNRIKKWSLIWVIAWLSWSNLSKSIKGRGSFWIKKIEHQVKYLIKIEWNGCCDLSKMQCNTPPSPLQRGTEE